MFIVEDPDCSLICSKASSMILAFLMYLSSKCFLSLLVAMTFYSLNFNMAIGFANSCFRPAAPPFSAAATPPCD